MFTNATSIIIDGKEVQSIKLTSNNAILYEKPSPQNLNVASVNISTDKEILSYYNNESATISATVLNSNNSPLPNKTVEFFKDEVSIGTATTDNNGIATKTYSAIGIGNVVFTATSENIDSTTLTVEDCIFYDSCTSNAKASAWTIPSGVTSQYSSDGWKVSANAYKQIKLTEKLTSDCSVEFTLSDFSTPSGNNSPVIIYAYTNGETTPNQLILANPSSSSYNVLGETKTGSLTKNGIYRIEYTSSTLKVYLDGNLLGSASNNVGLPTRFEIHQGANSRYAVYKDIKVKPLESHIPQGLAISLDVDNEILSSYNNDACTLSATMTNTGSPVANQTIEFYKNNVSIGTAQTDANGIATKVYTATGSGDVTFSAESDNISSNNVIVEDCIFFNATEISKKTGSSMIKGDAYTGVSIPTLPNHFMWSMDMKTSSNSSSENRFFLTATAHSGEQPTYALWVQIASSGVSRGGSRRNGTYSTSSSVTVSANTYAHFEVERNGDTITYYVNGTNVGSLTETWIDNYSAWWFSYSFWKRSNITGTWKNVKLKPL